MILPFWQRQALAGCPRFVPTMIPGCQLWCETDTSAHPTAVVFPADVVVNGTFAADANWTKGDANWTIPTPYALHTAGSVATLSQAAILVVGNTYATRIVVTNATAGTVTVSAGTTAATARYNAASTETLLCAGNTTLSITPTADFDGRITLVKADPRNASQLTDLTGLGHHLVQATAANQPLWVASGVGGLLRFVSAGTDFMATAAYALDQPCHRFVVANWTLGAGYQTLLCGLSADGCVLVRNSTDLRLYAGAGGLSGVNVVESTPYIYDMVFSGAASKVALNGAAHSTVVCGATNPGGTMFGRNPTTAQYLDADVLAVIEYQGQLSEANRQRVIRYLRRMSARLGVAIP